MKSNRENRDQPPRMLRVRHIELSEKHTRLRVVLFIVLLAVGIGALIYGTVHYLTTGSGWREITADTSVGESYSGEIFFYYDISGNGSAAGVEYRQVRALYSEASVYVYRLFHPTEEFAGVYNLAYLNRRINEPVTVDAALYRALEQIVAAGNRTVFYAPYYGYYQNLFFCNDPSETENYDPLQNEAIAAEFARYADHVDDPDSIRLELLGDNRVCLHVSEDYLALMRECGVEAPVDFFWLRNAFVLDYLAGVLTEHGFTNGALSSFDGYVRSLDTRGTEFSLPLYSREDAKTVAVGEVVYHAPMSFVTLRDYPLNGLDGMNYFVFDPTDVRHPYVNAQGYCRAALPQLVCASTSGGCAEIALHMADVYLADAFDLAALCALAEQGIGGIFIRDSAICYTDPALEPLLRAADGYRTERHDLPE